MSAERNISRELGISDSAEFNTGDSILGKNVQERVSFRGVAGAALIVSLATGCGGGVVNKGRNNVDSGDRTTVVHRLPSPGKPYTGYPREIDPGIWESCPTGGDAPPPIPVKGGTIIPSQNMNFDKIGEPEVSSVSIVNGCIRVVESAP